MVSIQIDEQTAAALQEQAQRTGLSVSDYLRQLLPVAEAKERPSWEELERQIVALSSDEGSLPDDFSRADMYDDHD
jgi:Arc/MetJ-type ribon-helix-helix transcriptional regulator